MDKKRVLLVEDDSFLRELFLKKLKQFDFEIEGAQNGREGIEKVSSFKPDIVVLDIIMPEVNGIDVIKAIRALDDRDLSSVPILVVSNLGQEEEIAKALRYGANDYLIKAHFDTDEIVRRIEEQLQGGL